MRRLPGKQFSANRPSPPERRTKNDGAALRSDTPEGAAGSRHQMGGSGILSAPGPAGLFRGGGMSGPPPIYWENLKRTLSGQDGDELAACPLCGQNPSLWTMRMSGPAAMILACAVCWFEIRFRCSPPSPEGTASGLEVEIYTGPCWKTPAGQAALLAGAGNSPEEYERQFRTAAPEEDDGFLENLAGGGCFCPACGAASIIGISPLRGSFQ